VSVITASFNMGCFLPETIASVRAQSYEPIEMIVVDDGSSDDTWDIIQSAGPLVRGLHQANAGQSHARARGVAASRGRYLLFLDADDLLAPDTIAAGVSALEERTDTLAATGWRRLVRKGERWIAAPADVPFPAADSDPLRAWLLGSWLPLSCLLWPRDVYERVGGWDEELTTNEDGDLIYRALAGGVRLVRTTAGEAFYRSHGDGRLSLSADMMAEHRFRSRMRVLEKLGALLAQLGTLPHYTEPLGVAWHRLAHLGYEDHPDLARECLRRGEKYAGRRRLSRTLPGRVLTWMLGLERKEALVQMLSRFGLATRERRRYSRLRQIQKLERESSAASSWPSTPDDTASS
jgi:glycosyltransferase involved in cell wall biosynthesis